ncbi:hypothetical protein Clacol_010137 [Clathrus columnatus]|uniref:Arrestin-like N-terminal domain-containing protein n=1 Tax=Clathrus columnatus TaxID=1419009 RepID=A0AAV5ART5_9AGAM|nr:hypothetical protein Clacol_010137 [Clathrus columnatus]
MKIDIQAPPPYEYVDPPSYTARVNTASSPPASSPAVSPTRPTIERCYKGKNLVLCLEQNRLRTLFPIYGLSEDITGHVLIKRSIKKVKFIKVHIEGFEGISVVGSSGGGSRVNKKWVAVLKASQTLLEAPEGHRDITCMEGLYPFTFTLPSYVTGGTEPLPPSVSFIRGGMTTDVIYFIRVEMIRNGRLRANEGWVDDALDTSLPA